AFGGAVDFGQQRVNGLLNRFQGDLADFALVGARLVFHDGHAVLLVARVPGLDGAPGELARLALLVGEGQLTDRPDAGLEAVALGHVDGPQHAHLQIRSRIFHEEFCYFVSCFVFLAWPLPAFYAETAGLFLTVRRLRRRRRGGAQPYGVAAGRGHPRRTTRARQFGPAARFEGWVWGAIAEARRPDPRGRAPKGRHPGRGHRLGGPEKRAALSSLQKRALEVELKIPERTSALGKEAL